MKAIAITSLEGPDAVELVELPDPVAGDVQVLIEVKATGVSFPEVLQTRGLYQLKPELPFVPGSECAGVVASAPADSKFKPGDRVAALAWLGAFAEKVVTDESRVFALPDSVSFEAGAAILLNYLTMHFGLIHRGQLTAGETVLVHGAAGGIGTASIQIAKAYGAGKVVAVVSDQAKAQIARDAGADEIVMVEGFKDKIKELTNGRGVDIVVDPVGGDRFTDSLRSLATDGRLLVIGFTAGEIPSVRTNRLLLNNISVVGVGWGAYILAKPEFLNQQWEDILPHLISGAINPPIGAKFSLDEAAKALKLIDERKATGKVVLTF